MIGVPLLHTLRPGGRHGVAPAAVLSAGWRLAAHPRRPEELGGICERRSAMAGTLVAEALGHGDMGLAVAALAPGSVATALGLWGTEAQQQTYLPVFTDGDLPAAALALTEPTVLFDVLAPATAAVREADGGFRLDGLKSAVVRGHQAELFVVGARLEGAACLFLVESSTPGLTVGSDPAMGVRAASLRRLHLDGVRVPAEVVLGAVDGSTYVECVRLSRIAWCALAVGTGQAVLDYSSRARSRHPWPRPRPAASGRPSPSAAWSWPARSATPRPSC